MEHLLGVISDTHGLLRDEVRHLLAPCDLIIHAGDVGDSAVLEELRKITRVVAVRGNTDKDPWAKSLPQTALVEYHGKHIFVLHNLALLDLDPGAAGIDAVIFGHSHQPCIKYTDHLLYLNPGSVGPRRFSLPTTMACIRIKGNELVPEIITINESGR